MIPDILMIANISINSKSSEYKNSHSHKEANLSVLGVSEMPPYHQGTFNRENSYTLTECICMCMFPIHFFSLHVRAVF